MIESLSWHAALQVLCAIGSLALWGVAWIERPRKPDLLPPPSKNCQRRGPQCAGRIE